MAIRARAAVAILILVAAVAAPRGEQSKPRQLAVKGTVVRPNSRAVRGAAVVLRDVESDAVAASATTDRQGRFSVHATEGRRYVLSASEKNERGEVGPFELTQATAPVLIVLR